MVFLASVGSSAPFIGLFGTVWGIMNAFTAIAAAKNTNLAVVAPGIAEALFATAIGLVAAIPAVHRLQQDHHRPRPLRQTARRLRRRVRRDPVAPARGSALMAGGMVRSGGAMAAGAAGASRCAPMAEINVTPLVDVMLVLLIIFMVDGAAADGGRAGRPAADQRPTRSPRRRSRSSSRSTRRASVYLQETEVPMENLVARLQAITGANAGDPRSSCAATADRLRPVMEVMGPISQAGFTASRCWPRCRTRRPPRAEEQLDGAMMRLPAIVLGLLHRRSSLAADPAGRASSEHASTIG